VKYNHYAIWLLSAVLLCTSAFAQQSVSTLGDTAYGDGGEFSFTAGLVAYASVQTENVHFRHGVQHGFQGLPLNTDYYLERLAVNVFPNPTRSNLNVAYHSSARFGYRQLCLYSPQGQKLLTVKPDSDNEKISLRSLPAGVYFLHVDPSNQVFRIVKTN
jgi:hypothetical protein